MYLYHPSNLPETPAKAVISLSYSLETHEVVRPSTNVTELMIGNNFTKQLQGPTLGKKDKDNHIIYNCIAITTKLLPFLDLLVLSILVYGHIDITKQNDMCSYNRRHSSFCIIISYP